MRQGPDGLLYVLTDEDEAALLKIEPAYFAVTAVVYVRDANRQPLAVLT